MTWLGIDFSGDAQQWKPGRHGGNIWVATLTGPEDNFILTDLRRIQELLGTGLPFHNLGTLLAQGAYRAAAIDAPFSVPASYLPAGGHSALLRMVDEIPSGKRPFPDSRSFVTIVAGMPPPLRPPKPLRKCEELWSHRVNVRSTLWVGPRGGAAMTASCLKLLTSSGRPLWPWAAAETPACIAEAFPATQLWQWRLPYTNYSGAEGVDNRTRIITGLSRRLRVKDHHRSILLEDADALDAVLCAFAAVAVSTGRLSEAPAAKIRDEGWIATHT